MDAAPKLPQWKTAVISKGWPKHVLANRRLKKPWTAYGFFNVLIVRQKAGKVQKTLRPPHVQKYSCTDFTSSSISFKVSMARTMDSAPAMVVVYGRW